MGRGARGSPRDGHRRNRGEAPRPLARGVGAGTFSVLGLPKSWEPGEGRLVLEVRPNREGILPKPFALELLVPLALRPGVPPVGEEEALRVQGRVVEGLLVVEEVEKVPRPPEREGGAAKGDGPPPGRRRRERAGPSGGVG
jgi:hypothetical protein